MLVYALPTLPILNDNFSNIDFTQAKEAMGPSYLSPEYYGSEGVKPPPQKNDFISEIFIKAMSEIVIKEID